MNDALIGYTGFVGKNVKKLHKFKYHFNSKNIKKIRNKKFNNIFCCGLPSLMWKANKFPSKDLKNILNLKADLSNVRCKKFILISSVEVYDHRFVSNEKKFFLKKKKLNYGFNRLVFEKFIEKNFPKILILRMPVIYGKYLKKNILFDIINLKNLDKINLEDQLQFYNIKNIFKHINICKINNIKKINLISEPIKVKEIVKKLRPEALIQCKSDRQNKRTYNVKSIYSKFFNKKKNYIISKEKTLLDMKKFYKSQKNKK